MQVIVGDESHIFQYEADGVSVLGGVGMHTVPTADNGELPLAALSKAVRYALQAALQPDAQALLWDFCWIVYPRLPSPNAPA